MKKLKAIIATGIITCSLLTTTSYASNHDFQFTLSCESLGYSRTTTYSKDDDDRHWYYNITSFKNESDSGNAVTYISTADKNNNTVSGWAKVTGTTKSAKSKSYNLFVSHEPGDRYKLQGRGDQYIATLSGKFCP